MTSMGFTIDLKRDVVVKQPTERRYCDNVRRTCARTGWEMRCNAPLFFGKGNTGGRCRVCEVVTSPDIRNVAWSVHTSEERREAHRYVDRPGWPNRSDVNLLSNSYVASYESQQRPRAIVEDVEPYWQCSNREVLDEMGITAEVMSMADAIAVRNYDQLDPKMQAFLDDPGQAETYDPILPPGVGHTSAEWRRAIARCHQYHESWPNQWNAVMASRTKEQYGVAQLRDGERAYGAVPYANLRGNATISYMPLWSLSDAAWTLTASPLHFTPALNSVTGQPLVVSTTQHTVLDDDSGEYGDEDD